MRAASPNTREEPVEDPELQDEAQGARGSVARMVRKQDARRVAAADERSLRLSIKCGDEPLHRLAAFAGSREDPSTSVEFEELWGAAYLCQFLRGYDRLYAEPVWGCQHLAGMVLECMRYQEDVP